MTTTEGIALAVERANATLNPACMWTAQSLMVFDEGRLAAILATELIAEQAAHEATRAKLAASDAAWTRIDQISVANGWSQHCMDFGMNEAATIAASNRPEPEVDVLLIEARKLVAAGHRNGTHDLCFDGVMKTHGAAEAEIMAGKADYLAGHYLVALRRGIELAHQAERLAAAYLRTGENHVD